MTAWKPAARQACASCTGVAGLAASTASVQRMRSEGTVVCTAGTDTTRTDASCESREADGEHGVGLFGRQQERRQPSKLSSAAAQKLQPLGVTQEARMDGRGHSARD